MEEVQSFIKNHHFALVYISRINCSVCHAVLPQVQNLLADFPEIQMIKADADQIPTVAGEFSVFTVPAILLFVNGKEMIRKARFVVMGELEHQLRQIVTNY
ncbi:thioredoxin family protein [Jeotgalibaca ciconiae]|nr:thioredoxin family protein [Jeotgalibaca ciconiae]